MYRTVVKGALPVGYDVQMKKLWAAIADGAAGVVFVTRYPRSDKAAWLWVTIWGISLLVAVWSVTLYLVQRQWGEPFLYINTVALFVDFVMLYHSVKGFEYRRVRRGKVRRRAD